jgi:hypothetical protein
VAGSAHRHARRRSDRGRCGMVGPHNPVAESHRSPRADPGYPAWQRHGAGRNPLRARPQEGLAWTLPQK